MYDERTTNVLGHVKRKFAIYVLVLAIVSILIKVILNNSFIILDALPEILLLIGLLITNLTKPKDEVEDERVTKEINEHYNKAFKIVFPLTIISYIFSIVIMFKSNIVIYLPPNLFINTFLLIVFMGLIVLVRKHQIYLNKFIFETNGYYRKVFKNILVLFIMMIFLTIFSILLNVVIPGYGLSNLLLVVLFVSSFFNLATQYFLYSIYEYNHYNESIEISEGKYPILTRNMFLYFVIIYFYQISVNIISIINIKLIDIGRINMTIILLNEYITKIRIIYIISLLIIIVQSLKISLSRLKNYDPKQVKKIVTIANIYIVTLAINFIVPIIVTFLINNNIINYKPESLSMLMWISFISEVFCLLVLLISFRYSKANKFPKYQLLLVPILTLLTSIIGYFIFSLPSINNMESRFILNIIGVVMLIISFIAFIYVIKSYSKTFEEVSL